MAEAGLPRPETTPATPAPSETHSTIPELNVVYLRFDPDYLITVPGIVKISQISLSLLGFICCVVSLEGSSPIGKLFASTSMLAVCYTGSLLGLYVFHVVEKYQHKVPWLKIELGFCGVWITLFIVISSIILSQWGDAPLFVAANFGQRTAIAYGVDLYLKWGGVMRGHLAQQKRVEYQYPVTDAVNTMVSSAQSSTMQQTV